MKKRLYPFFLLVGLVLASCNSNSTNSSSNTSSSTSTTTSSTTSTTTSTISTPKEIDLDVLHQNLTTTSLALSQNLLYEELSSDNVENVEAELTTMIDFYISSDEYFLTEYDSSGNTYIFDHYFKDENGFMSTKELLKDNTIEVSSYEGEMFDDYFINPFRLVEKSELSVENEKVVVNSENFNYLVYLICGYDFSIESFVIDVDDENNPVSFVITSEIDDSYADSYGVLIRNTLTGLFVKKETVNVPVIEPGVLTEDHAKLKDAFDKLKAGNYSFHYHDEDFDGENSVDIDALVTNEAILITYGEEQYGFLDTDKGLVEFEVDNSSGNTLLNGTTIADATKTVLDDVISAFDYAPEVFNYLGNNKFTLPLSQTLYEDITHLLPDTILGDNSSLIVPGAFYIILNNDGSVEFNYMWEIPSFNYGGFTQVVVSNFGTTEFPYDVNSQFVEKQPTNWFEYSSDFAMQLQQLIGDANKVPFYNPEEAELMDVGYDESGNYAYIMYSMFEEGTISACYEELIQLLTSNGYVHKGQNEFEEESYYLGEDIEIGIIYDESYNAIMLSIYSRKVYVMPTKITWTDHDSKYGTEVKTQLDELIGDASLIPCYDFEKQYWFLPNTDNTVVTLSAQSYSDTMDEKGYYEAMKADLLALGYTLDSSTDKDVFNYQDQFTVSVDASFRYCTITITIL